MYLEQPLKHCFRDDAPLFTQLMALSGECYRALEGRKTMRVCLGGKEYFIKQHRGVGWREIFKNLLQLKWPVISARNEWEALQKLESLGIAVPHVAGFGEQGCNPAKRESFVLMEALLQVVSLEELTASWKNTPPTFALKQQIIKEAARITRVMHENGINHRDFYICHLLLDLALLKTQQVVRLYVIDLHRAQLRKQVPERWKIKDLAALYFSSLDAGLTRRDWFRFMKHYRNLSLRDILQHEKSFWQKVKKRGDELYRDHAN